MQSTAPSARYSPAAIQLHWLTAALILLNWSLPHITGYFARSDAPRIIGLHRSIGVTILVLVLLRAGWRFFNPPPPLPGGTPPLLRIAAKLGHAALYLLMIAVPVLGILFTWAGGRTLEIWSIVQIAPPDWAVSDDLHDTLRALHGTLANAILWLVGLHVAAVLLHHYGFSDGLAWRMLPARFRGSQPRL